MTENMHFKILKYISKMKYPAKNPAKFLKPEPEPEPDIEAGYPAGSGFSRISGRFLLRTMVDYVTKDHGRLYYFGPW